MSETTIITGTDDEVVVVVEDGPSGPPGPEGPAGPDGLTTEQHALIDHTGIPGVGDHPDSDHADAFASLGHEHDEYVTDAEQATALAGKEDTGVAATAVAAHEGAADPHAQYVTSDEQTAALAGKSDTSHSHSYEAAGAVAAHEGEADPHAQYVTDDEHALIDHTGIPGAGGGDHPDTDHTTLVKKSGDEMSGNLTFTQVNPKIIFKADGSFAGFVIQREDGTRRFVMEADSDDTGNGKLSFGTYNDTGGGFREAFFLRNRPGEGSGLFYVPSTFVAGGDARVDGLLTLNGPAPTADDHAARKQDVDAKVDKSGDTMTGGLLAPDVGANTVSIYTTPTADDHAARKQDVDARLPKASVEADGTTADLDPSTEWVGRWDITDDASPTAGWPDRLSFRFDGERTGWFNEYGEVRVTAAKNSTIPLKVNAKSPTATARILQVNDDQSGNEVFAVDVNGAEVASPHGMLPLMPVWTGTQAEYDALTPDPRVLYAITGP